MTRMNRVSLLLVVLAGVGMTVAIALSHVRAAGEDVPASESGAADFLVPLPATVAGASQNGHEAAALNDPLASATGEDPFLQPRPFRSPRVHTGATPQQGADPFAPLQRDAAGASSPVTADEEDSKEGKLILEIRNMGGYVARDENRPGQPVIAVTLDGNKYTASFLERLKVFPKVQVLNLKGRSVVEEAGSRHLKGLSELRTLLVSASSVNNAFLEGLRELPRLENLRLKVAQLGNTELESLGRLTQLVSLDLHGSPVTDIGLSHLRGLSQLRTLDLCATQVTDSGLQHLGGLRQLQSLSLGGTQVGDDGLAHLSGLTQLTNLNLTGTRITDEGLEHLGGLVSLEVLSLDMTAVSGRGLVHLLRLTGLRSLSLDGSGADAAAIRRFKRGLPRAQVEPGVLVWGWDRPAGDADVRLTPATEKILSSLAADTRLEFVETPLKDVAVFLAGQHELTIQLDDLRLREAGLGADLSVTRSIQGIALHSALRMILAEIGLTYIIRDDALLITTAEEGRRLAAQGVIGADEVSREFQRNGRLFWLLQDDVRLQGTAVPLENVVEGIRKKYAIDIGIDRRSLTAAGVRPDARCTLDAKGVPLASALRKLLGDMGLTYVVDGEVLLITAPKKGAPAMKPGSPSAGQVLPPQQAQPAAGDDATRAPNPASGATADESAAITELEQLNARITHDDQAVGRPVIAVRLGGDRVQDAALQWLQAFPRLTSLTLLQTDITDAGLVHLGGLSRLEVLGLQHTHITDAGVPHLLEVTGLRELDLRGTWVTDDGVKRLAGLTKLQSLDLTGIPVAEATVEQLKRASPKLVLTGAEITSRN